MSSMIKTADELMKIMKAAAMGDICFSHILEYIKPGMTEKEVADEIERTLMGLGAQGLSFPTICVSGENTTQPHGEPSDRKIQEGDFVTMDFGAVVEGYCGDMTRTIGIGSLSHEQKKVYDTVLRSQLEGLTACRAGVKCRDVDRASRSVIEKAGYGEFYIHGTGHGVGREVHEAPTLNAGSEETLEEFMPVTVEPGIYIPGKFGVRIEDLAIITDFGIINAVKSEKSLIII
ncbi:MAG TPA: aminopeptidase P family protein [Candidatus Copromorpha excrementigallinarum]|uniref:Aminopeptidase P family protein n=1 Tax=Candidatus Allocopromorpha excrementigallinarum TaxID=2840742 RepID=A0A9D1I181_9FIRM|nr:aminopeptidase P family protein [Candidatus Copromorpha excrementigallinarum]